MSSLINVNRKVHDAFYRYKMPRIVGKVEGRGNGIKTVLSNIAEVAKSLNVPPDYPTKYLGIELGAQVILDTKNDKFIINGAHVDKKLQILVYEFIERYLLCSECQNPETVLSVHKERIRKQCQACGFGCLVTQPHRFNTYIIKHPPKSVGESIGNTRESIIGGHAQNGANGAIGRENSEEVNNTQNISSTNGNLLNCSNISTNSNNCNDKSINNGLHNDKNGEWDNWNNADWSVDTTDTAVKERMLELTNKAAELIFHEDLEKSIPERLKIFSTTAVKLIKPYLCINDDLTDNVNAINDFETILHEAKRLDIIDESVIIVSELIFDSDNILERIKQFCGLLSKIVRNNKAEVNFLSSIELVVAQYPETAVQKISNVFFCLYQLELVQEDTFMQWSAKKSKRYLGNSKLTENVHKAASGFINWLKTAEEESSDGSAEIEFEETNVENAKEFSAAKWAPVQTAGDDDDINIDDI